MYLDSMYQKKKKKIDFDNANRTMFGEAETYGKRWRRVSCSVFRQNISISSLFKEEKGFRSF